MAKLTVDMSMSLDGYIAGPNGGVENPLGDGGERLHRWAYELANWRERQGIAGGQNNRDAEVVEESFANVGATVMGRRMFDEGEGPWGDEPPFRMPVFVLTHNAREKLVKGGGTTFTFVTDGIESALRQATAARATKMSGSRAALIPFSISSEPDYSLNCRSTLPPYSSAMESDCSTA